MRQPERIDKLTELIREAWKEDPDMRFLQLIYVLQARFSQANNGRGKIERIEKDGFKKIGYDLFGTEDEEFTEFLETYLNKKHSNKSGEDNA
ncbi:hypothetical protein SH580_18415 [Coraliomargarita algicola]|uniref:Uncharacterized protein n=1 Tax=Coraliomargarita algicola TaxID=3092156 RepID=A0ABZ0RIP7_9BACT|nr:hypothetical protein [Coraliomargarita sp. J2-16]WPJ95397.1 hypothetical protein SH580_18415 [Coraliomargarita sp. J2-16]